ncbi:MAG: Arc/MetJ family transcription regulator [Rhodothermales bacterium]|jgi:Arc/MetJ family transcription regulator
MIKIMCISGRIYTHHPSHVRTNIVIDDALMSKALQITGLRTKREAVELGLRTLVRLGEQASLRELRGKLSWDGDLDDMRTDR